jgi:hypothetical protein
MNNDQYAALLKFVFKTKYDRLKSLSKTCIAEDILELSALLRHFLIDGNCLLDQISNYFSINSSFKVPKIKGDSHLIFSPNYKPEIAENENRSRKAFLALDCIRYNEHIFTVHSLIELVANHGGGVHIGKIEDDIADKLDSLGILKIEATSAADTLHTLRVIADHTLIALEDHRKAIDGITGNAKQNKKMNQPVIHWQSGKPGVSIDKNSSVESFVRIDQNKGFTLVISFLLATDCSFPSIVADLGSYQQSKAISFKAESRDLMNVLISGERGSEEFGVNINPGETNYLLFSLFWRSDGSLQTAVNLNAGEHIHRETSLIWEPTPPLEGKFSYGTDIRNKNGARLVGNPGLLLYHNFYDESMAKSLLRHLLKIAPPEKAYSTGDVAQSRSIGISALVNQTPSHKDG